MNAPAPPPTINTSTSSSASPLSSSPPLLSPQRPSLRSSSVIARDRYSAVAGRAAVEAEKQQQAAAAAQQQQSLPAKPQPTSTYNRDRDDRPTDKRPQREREDRSDDRRDRNGTERDRQHDRHRAPVTSSARPSHDRWERSADRGHRSRHTPTQSASLSLPPTSHSQPSSSPPSSTQSSLFAIPLVAPSSLLSHPLHHKWTLYFDHRPATKAKPANTATFDTNEYESSLIVVGIITTVESFWQYWRSVQSPALLDSHSNYHLFRHTADDDTPIKPTWEDKSNSGGGRWTIKWHARDKDKFDTLTLNLCLAVIGQAIGSESQSVIDDEEVTGIVVSRRRTGDRLSVWNRSREDATTKALGVAIKSACVADMQPQPQLTLNYDLFEALTH